MKIDAVKRLIFGRLRKGLERSPTWGLGDGWETAVLAALIERTGIDFRCLLPLACDSDRSVSLPFVAGTVGDCRTGQRLFVKMVTERSRFIINMQGDCTNQLSRLSGGQPLFPVYESVKRLAKDSFELQERMARVVASPKPVALLSVSETVYGMVFEYVDGRPLLSDMSGRNMMEMFVLLKVMWDHGMVHGDVKPENFMLSDGVLYVFDPLVVNGSAVDMVLISDLTHAVAFWERFVSRENVLSCVSQMFGSGKVGEVEAYLEFR